LTRLINNRLGLTRQDDALPYKVHACPIQTGATAGKHIPQATFERLLDLYYQKRGWDADGNPPAEAERLHSAC
jgi:aldehyde:ferredoxin oxidoreductase